MGTYGQNTEVQYSAVQCSTVQYSAAVVVLEKHAPQLTRRILAVTARTARLAQVKQS